MDFIIVNYNSYYFLKECLHSVFYFSCDFDHSIFLIDNGDGVNDIRSLKKAFPNWQLLRNKTNIGFAAAVNKGLNKSRSKYVILLNPDTLLTKGFLKKLVPFLENNPKVGIVCPKILNPDGTVQGSARAFPNLLTALFGRTSPLTKIFPNNQISRKNILTIDNQDAVPIEVDWVSGACMVVRRKAIEDVGLLDERFFMYWEDADWCRRMWEKGWKVVYFPQASIYHHVGKSSQSRPLQSIYHFHKSAYRLHEKYTQFPLSLLNPLVLVLLAFRGIIAGVIRMAKKKKPIH